MKNNKKIVSIVIIIVGLIAILINKKETTTVKTSDNMEMNTNLTQVIIGFYNVENLFDIYDDPETFDDDFTPYGDMQWDQERYDQKLDHIGEMITTINSNQLPAIMGFSEVENHNVLKDLIESEALANSGYRIIHKDNHDNRGIDVAAIYKPEAFNVAKYTYYPVILPGKDEATTRDILEIKGTFSNGEEATVYFTHWSSRRKGTLETEPKRIATAKVMRHQIDAILKKNPDANIFILGDFNDEPSDISVKKYLMKNEFYNLSAQFENTINGTVNHQGDWLVFDQIIASNAAMKNPAFKLTRKSAHIHKTENNTYTHRDGNQVPSRTYGGRKYYGGYSDHYPVYLKLKMN